MQRPTVSVFNHKDENSRLSEVRLPHVFTTSIRNDIVQFVHDQLSKNLRQAHGVDPKAGMKHSAESWGPGRAVARVPRVSGSGTHRTGQGAFANMCRKGRLAFPLQTWRRWHRKVNLRQRRHALASALAATAVPSLVMARGHRITKVPQLPLILDNQVNQISKTKEIIKVLKRFGIYEDVERCRNAKKIRAGKGKARNNRYKNRQGPLFVVDDGSVNLRRALKNIPSVTVLNVKRLNIRNLAPGGHLGRFCVFTQDSFIELEKLFGSFKGVGLKKDYLLKREVLTNPDVSGLINSDPIQRLLRNKQSIRRLHDLQKKNPLKNVKIMTKLNPFSEVLRKETSKLKPVKKDKKIKKIHKAKSVEFLKKINEKVNNQLLSNNEDYKELYRQTKV